MFQDGPIHDVRVRPLKLHRDARGWLAELFRHDELPAELFPAMAYVSVTEPSITRGPHEHVQQTDHFAFLGPGDFEIVLWDARPTSPTFRHRWKLRAGESAPQTVVIPPGVVHAYRNVSAVPGWVWNAPNRLFAGPGKKEPVDEIRHENDPNSPYQWDNESVS